MIAALVTWIVLALVLGLLIGRAIHLADVVEFPGRTEQAWWVLTPPPAAARGGAEPSTKVDEPGLLVA